MMRRVFVAVGLVVAGLGLPASALAQGAGTGVSAQDDQFAPAMTSVASGKMLTWQNDGVEQHTITADDGAFDSGNLDPGQTFGFTFDTPGTFAYYCSIHGGPNGQGMAGVVVVLN
jgi:plastocyanin